MDLGLKGAHVLVTGSSRGIGRAIAEAFLQEEATVILTGRDRAVVQETEDTFKDRYGKKKVLGFSGDLQKKEVLETLAVFIQNETGSLDHLVCNIGSGRSVPPLKEDLPECQRMMDINFWHAVAAVETMRPLLRKAPVQEGRHASITFTGSICGVAALGCPVGYAAAKSAMTAYAKNIARPLGKEGIRVNVVSPGNVIFAGSVWEKKLADSSDEVKAMLQREVPLGRFGEPREIADVIVFLASRRANFVTGANWIVDGGQTR